MDIIETKIKDLFIVEPDVFKDNRGYFFESYSKKKLDNLLPINYTFVQDNESSSSYGVLRGLHYQLEPYSQTKLVRVIQGEVYDVAVDIRKGSLTFGQWVGVELTGENKKQMLIPKGFAHGFVVLSETAVFAYKCDEYYNPSTERGIIFDDPELGIDWKIPSDDIIIADKDRKLPILAEAEMNF
ncbi:dTDP-4-dehydrorhamnose 3,5-epimerase [Methanolobus psychrophilus R15]|nr:dTDP-4-dehydrorhamnose 3,5-epimerase [Methanolobus psychrophilus R15]